MIKLSVIIVNYNTGELLARCLRSIKAATHDFQNPATEVIVIDNASKDESITLRQGSGQASIKTIENKTNVGFAKAVNQGIKIAKSEYILLLNPDTEVKDDAIRKLMEFAQDRDDLGVVGTRLINPDGSIQPSVFHAPTIWRAVREFWLGQEGAYSKYTPKGNGPVMVDAVVGAVFLITPQARKKVGLLDERYFMYFEDLDYCRRVKKAGLKVYYLPSAQIVHHHGISGQSVANQANQWRRLVPSSKIYHGLLKHHLITFVIWSGVKFWSLFNRKS